MTTLQQVAARAGCSLATASRALSLKGSVSDTMSRRVRRAAAELGYRSTPAIGKGGRRPVIGVLIPSITNPVFSSSLSGIEDRMLVAGHGVLIAQSHYEPAREAAAIQALLNDRPTGLILTLCDPSNTRNLPSADGPVAGVAFMGFVNEERLMGKQRQPATIALFESVLQPFELSFLFIVLVAEKQRVEADEAPVIRVLNPAVVAGKCAPALEALGIHWLIRARHVADIMIARHDKHRDRRLTHQIHAEGDVAFLVRVVDREIAGMDDEVSSGCLDPI